ncbi:hypothetical protein KR093_006658, partial [Drosophila rubida]
VTCTMWALLVILLVSSGGLLARKSRFTNLKCAVLDPSYCSYDICYLKVLGREIVGINILAKLLKGPFHNAKVNLSLWRKFSGFRPFMFNVTFDFCKYMSQSTTNLSFQKIILDALATRSNLNHSCPYEVSEMIHAEFQTLINTFQREIIVQDLVFSKEFIKYLPLPSGEYQVRLMAATDNDWKTEVDITMFIDEY